MQKQEGSNAQSRDQLCRRPAAQDAQRLDVSCAGTGRHPPMIAGPVGDDRGEGAIASKVRGRVDFSVVIPASAGSAEDAPPPLVR